MIKVHCSIQRHFCLIWRQKDWLFLTVIWANDLHILANKSMHIHLCLCDTEPFLMAILPGHISVMIPLLKVPELFIDASFKLEQELFVSLHSHNYLTVDVFDVHIFPTVPSMSSHERCFVSSIWIYVVNSCSSCSVLQRCSNSIIVILSSLLDGVDWTIILIQRSSLGVVLWLLHIHLLSVLKAWKFVVYNFAVGLCVWFVWV